MLTVIMLACVNALPFVLAEHSATYHRKVVAKGRWPAANGMSNRRSSLDLNSKWKRKDST
jgi:hypothetical protein